MYDDYANKGVVFILVVGQDQQGQPATTATAKEYKASHGYQPGWHVVADPNWVKLDSVIEDNYGAIPAHRILDKDMVLRHASASEDFVWDPEVNLIKLLQAQGLYP